MAVPKDAVPDVPLASFRRRPRGSRVIPVRRAQGEQRDLQRALPHDLDYPEDVERPLTRADCVNMPRPCPFVSCKHHLYLDANPDTGAITIRFPHLDVDEMAETCVLDVADRGSHTLEEVGKIYGVVRERVRQIETMGLRSLSRAGTDLSLPPERGE